MDTRGIIDIFDYKGTRINVQRGNDIKETDIFGRIRTLKTLITSSKLYGETHYACYVVKHSIWPSRITRRRIRDAVAQWKLAIDDIIEQKTGKSPG